MCKHPNTSIVHYLLDISIENTGHYAKNENADNERTGLSFLMEFSKFPFNSTTAVYKRPPSEPDIDHHQDLERPKKKHQAQQVFIYKEE